MIAYEEGSGRKWRIGGGEQRRWIKRGSAKVWAWRVMRPRFASSEVETIACVALAVEQVHTVAGEGGQHLHQRTLVIENLQQTVATAKIDKSARWSTVRLGVQVFPDDHQPCKDYHVLPEVLLRISTFSPIMQHPSGESDPRFVKWNEVSSGDPGKVTPLLRALDARLDSPVLLLQHVVEVLHLFLARKEIMVHSLLVTLEEAVADRVQPFEEDEACAVYPVVERERCR